MSWNVWLKWQIIVLSRKKIYYYNMKHFLILYITSGGTRYYSEKKFIIACLIWSLSSAIFFSYFDISFLTILWWTILIPIWAESNFFDTYEKKFWSPTLIVPVFQSYHSLHPVSTLKLFQSISCFYHVFIQILILFFFWMHPNVYPTSISISIIILFVSRFYSRPKFISILLLLCFCTTKASF